MQGIYRLITFALMCWSVNPVNDVAMLIFTHLHQSFEMLQHSFHWELQEVIVSQVKSSQTDPWEHTKRKAPQQVGVEKQQLQGRHGVKSAGINLMDFIILKIKVPKDRKGNKANVSRLQVCFRVTNPRL